MMEKLIETAAPKLFAMTRNGLYTWGRSQCALIICELDYGFGCKKERVYIATELHQNKGPSITNDAANLWLSVQEKFGPGRFIERYNRVLSYSPTTDFSDAYAEVKIKAGSPSWFPLDETLHDILLVSFSSFWSRKLSKWEFSYEEPKLP